MSHMGVFSWGQCCRNVFTHLLSFTHYLYFNLHMSPRLVSTHLASGHFFYYPPTHSCIVPHLIPHPLRGGSMKGVHPPTPSTFTPWSSRRQVVCFHAPRILPSRLRYHTLHAIAQTPASTRFCQADV